MREATADRAGGRKPPARSIFTAHVTPRRTGGPPLTDYEVGTASWDISQILTRHENVVPPICARSQSLRNTAMTGTPHDQRLEHALMTPCTCGMGDDDGERTSVIKAERLQAAADQKALEDERLIEGRSDLE